MGYGMHQEPAMRPTPITDNLAPATDTPYTSFRSFLEVQLEQIRREPVRKSNFSLARGFSAFGKSGALEDWVEEQTIGLTGKSIGNSRDRMEMGGEEVEVWNSVWSSALKAAMHLGLVESRAYGDWTPQDTHTVTRVMKQGITVMREGAKGIPAREGRKVLIFGIDVVSVTATANNHPRECEEDEYMGYDRCYTLEKELVADDEIRSNVFGIEVSTDAESQDRRLVEREQLGLVTDIKQLATWCERNNILVERRYLPVLLRYLPTSSATVHAATRISGQADDLLLRLDEDGEITLTEDDRTLLLREKALIEAGMVLTEPNLRRLQNSKIRIVVEHLYPHIRKSVDLPAKQVFPALNVDIAVPVPLDPRVKIGHDMIRHIAKKNINLLKPSDRSSEVYL